MGVEAADLIAAIEASARGISGGMLVSTSQAVEEFRILSGDFVTPDEDLANAISTVAISLGCSVVFDEQAGADTLKLV